MIFYTADLHLGYFPILHDTARPFSGVPEMDEALISNWNARVGADDSVYIVGDFSYNGGEAPTQYLSRLNGHLHLIRGNHDTGLNHAERLLEIPAAVPPRSSKEYAAVCEGRATRRSIVRLGIREGRKRQVKRMLAAVGHPVLALHRDSFGPLELGDLPRGAWRALDAEEVAALHQAIGRAE